MLLTINPFLIDKSTKSAIKIHNKKFVPMDISMDELAGYIGEGAAFSAQFNGNRRAANFKQAGFLAVDVDEGLSIQDAEKIPLYRNHCALLYTTHSHTEEDHHFRLVFELESSIDDRFRMEAAYSGLIATFGGDRACSDASRLFFGSSKGMQIHRKGLLLPTTVVDELVLLGTDFAKREQEKDKVKKVKTNDLSGATLKSGIWLPRSQKIMTAEGNLEYLNDLPVKTRVYCPVHNDRKPAAFVLESRQGVKGVHCGSKCKTTYFLDAGRNRTVMAQPYDFDYDWVSAINSSSESIETHLEALDEFFGGKHERIFTNKVNGQYLPESASAAAWGSSGHPRVLPSIIDIDARYIHAKDIACRYPKFTNDYFVGRSNALEKAKAFRAKTVIDDGTMTLFEEKAVHNWLLNEGMTFIKSPKGSGKTQMLEEIVETYPKLIENVRILLIGHRRSLINATADRLGLVSYLNTDETTQVDFNQPTSRYAISLDSMGRLLAGKKPYDVVIIDEVEQVFAHLLSDTLGNERMKAILYLQHFIRKAKHVFLLDADMTPLSIEIISALNKSGSEKDAFAVINTYKADGREINMYNHIDPKHIVADLMAALKAGKRCFLCSNSKDFIKGVTGQIRKKLPGKEVIAITSDNSQKQDIQEFIINIKEEAPKYDLIAVSPSVSTGVDITFPDDAPLIDCVFGVFHAGINTHFDIDQQLSRVRHPGQVNVWVSGIEYSFETDSNIICQEIADMHDQFESIKEIDEDGSPVYFEKFEADLLHEAIFGAVTEMKRASMNNLRRNFIALRKHNGWKVNPIERDEGQAALGGLLISEGETELETQKVSMILDAPQINALEIGELLKKSARTQREQAIVDRYFNEAFFHTDVTEEMLGTDSGRSLREAVKLYDIFQMSPGEREAKDAILNHELWFDGKHLRLKYEVLNPILMASGLFDGKRFIRGHQVSKESLSGFVEKCKEQKLNLETFFEIPVYGHMAFDPVSQLKVVLALFGVTTLREKSKSYAGGGREYFYSLNPVSLDWLEKWHAQYRDEKAKEKWSKERGIEAAVLRNASKAIQELRSKFQNGKDAVDLT